MAEESARENPTPAVRLRPASDDDESFLQTVYGDSRSEELMRVPWSEEQRAAFVRMQFAAQQSHYREHFPNATHEVILVDGRPAGRLYVDRRDVEIRILDISMLVEFRGRGVGSLVIKNLIEEADAEGKTVSVYVENYSPSRFLFERMGFRQVADEGINLLLERPAAAPLKGSGD
ncbi:MAG TPA: GNAT family N-acetyltransferase [Pyrinomonadaceae bacterium]|jgi:ribosomal protein S18 acetylase RimI-like enzyme